jgi:hypothetical protein
MSTPMEEGMAKARDAWRMALDLYGVKVASRDRYDLDSVRASRALVKQLNETHGQDAIDLMVQVGLTLLGDLILSDIRESRAAGVELDPEAERELIDLMMRQLIVDCRHDLDEHENGSPS